MRHRSSTLLLALLPLATAGCDMFYTVHGTVRDCTDQSPIEAATVRLQMDVDGEPEQSETKSERDGSFVAALNEPESDEPSVLNIEKAGYAPLVRDVTKPREPQDVCLAPQPK